MAIVRAAVLNATAPQTQISILPAFRLRNMATNGINTTRSFSCPRRDGSRDKRAGSDDWQRESCLSRATAGAGWEGYRFRPNDLAIGGKACPCGNSSNC